MAVIAGRTRTLLSASAELRDPTVVPAQYLTFELEGQKLPAVVWLDGRELPLLHVGASRGFFVVEASGSVGFHRLRVAEDEWYFATEDAKLRLLGILDLLDSIQETGLAWGGQLFFADGSALRHPKVDYAWLERAAPKILALADAIAERPLRRAHMVPAHQPPGVGKLFLRESIAFLRANASLLLEDPVGSIVVGYRTYSPRIVIAGKRERTFSIVGNRRMTELLALSLEMTRSLQSEARIPRTATAALSATARQLQSRLELFPFAQLRGRPASLSMRPAPEEVSDDRYRQAFDLHDELTHNLAWEAGLRRAEQLAYVQSADQIYQAFVAVALARAFEARQVVGSLRSDLRTPVFRSEAWEIYYDTVPPRPAFANWRDGSGRPSDQKPDLTIIDVTRQRGLLLDAKYRIEPNGRLPTSGIHDAQVYLQSFERKSIAICYPGSGPSIGRITAKGYTILEVSLGPFPRLEEYLRDELRPALEALMEPLNT